MRIFGVRNRILWVGYHQAAKPAQGPQGTAGMSVILLAGSQRICADKLRRTKPTHYPFPPTNLLRAHTSHQSTSTRVPTGARS